MSRLCILAPLLLCVTLMSASACSLLFDDGEGQASDAGRPGSDAGILCALSNVGGTGQKGTVNLTLKDSEVLIIDTAGVSMTLNGASVSQEWQGALLEVSAGFPLQRVIVLSLQTLEIMNNATLKAIGPLPLVIVASDKVIIAGDIDVSSYSSSKEMGGQSVVRGAGGYLGGAVRSSGNTCPDCCMSGMQCGGAPNPTQEHGGFGGSFGFLGGVVGKLAIDPASDFGTPELVPLVGGGGGAGTGGAGGHGGGAIQISAEQRIELKETGRILAGGAGGYGYPNFDFARGGGGGGAGGAILLEAPDLKIDENAILAVHGGSGGTGNVVISTSNGCRGFNGSTGPPTSPGTLANDQEPCLEPGSVGGAGSNPAGEGAEGGEGSTAVPGSGGGGAGGGAGRIRINHQGDPFEKDKAKFYPWVSFSEENNWCPSDAN